MRQLLTLDFLDEPRLHQAEFPEAEREAVSQIPNNLRHLRSAVEGYADSVALFLFSRYRMDRMPPRPRDDSLDKWQVEHGTLMAWCGIAGSNAAIETNGFWEAIVSVQNLLGSAKTLLSRVDKVLLKSARTKFLSTFPNIASIRTAAAHPGELSSTSEELAKQVAKGEHQLSQFVTGEGFFMDGTIVELNGIPAYTSTFKGKVLSIELTDRAVLALEDVARTYWHGFYPAEPAGQAETREWRRAHR